MRIVNREQFLAMPSGTVFCKYKPQVFDEICIKFDSLGYAGHKPFDFWYTPLADSLDDGNDSGERAKLLFAVQEEGTSIKVNYDQCSRDGLFDEDQLFAVYDREDVVKMIEKLAGCIGTLPIFVKE